MHLDQIHSLAYTKTYSFDSNVAEFVIKKSAVITQKIHSTIIPLFKPLSIAFLGLQALNEICIKTRFSKREETGEWEKQRARIYSSSEYFEEHGSLLLTTSFCGTVEVIGKSYQCSSQLIGAVTKVGSLAFLYANIVELIENIRIYDVLSTAMERSGWDYYGALSGIVSNLSHIAAIGSMLLSPWTTLAIIMSILGMATGGFKVLCELMQFDKHHPMVGLSTMTLSKN